ncbi:hypothetical protein GCM10018793_43160 [Streptomyces sulfonofaciens]|uniref:Uncharacterized protein n=1 Tax=Streptomyces sulfonofaciens TaxID=68272 RepID=A0A919L3P4_9ACTN|nr:hypothetical protein [Streptomyces sulfonofaciens]GHH82768.1 hypothetical protein GCM10018793_43160 [Streptomyces sulfonofaciens]
MVDGDLGARRFVATYRRGPVLTGVVAVNTPPRALRAWRAAIASRRPWNAVADGVPAAV